MIQELQSAFQRVRATVVSFSELRPQEGDQTVVLLGKLIAGLNGSGARVGGNTSIVTAALNMDTSAYAAGDSIGGRVVVAPFIKNNSGVLSGVTLLDRTNTKPALEIYFFDQYPTGATITDQAPFAWGGSGADAMLIGKAVVATTDWTTLNGKATASLTNLNVVMAPAVGNSLHMAIVCTGTPTFGSATALVLRLKFLVD